MEVPETLAVLRVACCEMRVVAHVGISRGREGSGQCLVVSFETEH